MKFKIVILAVVISLGFPAVSNAKGIRYPYKHHKAIHIRCPYAKCKSDIQP